MPFHVQTDADLLWLMRRESALHPFRKPPIDIELPQLSAEERAAWQLRLEDLRQQCGCTAGVVGLGGFALGSLLYIVRAALQVSSPVALSSELLWCCGILFLFGLIGSALVGKLVGLTLARVRFRKTCRELQALLRARGMILSQQDESVAAAPTHRG